MLSSILLTPVLIAPILWLITVVIEMVTDLVNLAIGQPGSRRRAEIRQLWLAPPSPAAEHGVAVRPRRTSARARRAAVRDYKRLHTDWQAPMWCAGCDRNHARIWMSWSADGRYLCTSCDS